MELKQWFYNSIGNNMPKNAIQFSLGVVFYYLIFGIPDALLVFLAFAGFMLTYSSVYVFNDLMDIEEDKKHPQKLKWKFIANGTVGKESAVSVLFLLMFSGLGLSLLVGKWFAAIMVMLLVLNFLHSSNFTRFKKSKWKTAFNMTAIEFLKYSCGWFALTSNLASFPFWMVLCLAVSYNAGYIIYKFDFRGRMIRQNRLLFGSMGAVGVGSYAISVLVYDFPLALFMMFVMAALVIATIKYSRLECHSMNNMMIIEYVLLPLMIISFLAMGISQVAAVNGVIREGITDVRTDIVQSIPEDIRNPVEGVIQELGRYQNAEDVEKGLMCLLAREAG